MSLLTWTTGAILAAALIPLLVLLYFLKLRRRPRPIACTLLWQKAVEDLQANAPFQKLRRSLLLFLQLIAIILLCLSVMQPRLHLGQQKGGRRVFLIDNSASMAAMDVGDGETRLDEAKRRARERIEALYSGGLLASDAGETMIIAFADGPLVYAPFSDNRNDLLAAIDRIEPTHGQTYIGDALRLSRAYTTNVVDPDSGEARAIGEPPVVEIFSDGGLADPQDLIVRGKDNVQYHRIGSAQPDNVSFGAVDVQRPYDRRDSLEVFVTLLNHNAEPVTCDLQLSLDGSAQGVQEVTIGATKRDESTGQFVPGRKSLVFLPIDHPRGAIIEVANLRPDDLAADNIVQVVVPPPKLLRVGLVESRSFGVRTALEGMALERLELLTARQFESLAANGNTDPYDVIVFDNYAPPEGLMPPGRYLSFGATPPVEGLIEFGEDPNQIVLNVRDQHPALRFINLDRLVITKCKLIQPGDDVEVLVEGSQGPIIVGLSRGPLHLIHVTFDPLESNWPLERSFVTFVFNAIETLGQAGEALVSRSHSVSDAITTRLPAGAADVTIRLPDGRETDVPVRESSMASWGPIRLTGLHTFIWSMPGAPSGQKHTRAFAANLISETEGRLAPVEQLDIGQESVTGESESSSAYTPLWPWAIAFALLVLMLEWWVYHRKAFL